MKKQSPISYTARKDRARAKTKEEAADLLRQDPAVQEFLQQFYGDGYNFLTYYMEWRAGLLRTGAAALRREQNAAARLAHTATQRLWQIQQRKLFVQQCYWRADELDLAAEGIETSADFGSWGQRIHACAWLPPITEAEVEEYLAYLETDDCQDLNPYFPYAVEHWQFHDAFWLSAYQNLDAGDLLYPLAAQHMASQGHVHNMQSLCGNWILPYPVWYYWCDEHHQPPTPVLRLPDLRGARENRYISTALRALQQEEAEEAAAAAQLPAPPPVPTVPTLLPLAPNDWNMIYRLLALESTQTQQYFKLAWPSKVRIAAFSWDQDEFLDTKGEELEDELLTETEFLPIVAHDDYRQAIFLTWLGSYRRRLQAAIRTEFAAYQQREAAGLPHPDPYPDPAPKAAQADLRQRHRAAILTGRALLDEPENFDF